jgi:hypothetical protein
MENPRMKHAGRKSRTISMSLRSLLRAEGDGPPVGSTGQGGGISPKPRQAAEERTVDSSPCARRVVKDSQHYCFEPAIRCCRLNVEITAGCQENASDRAAQAAVLSASDMFAEARWTHTAFSASARHWLFRSAEPVDFRSVRPYLCCAFRRSCNRSAARSVEAGGQRPTALCALGWVLCWGVTLCQRFGNF